MKCITNTELIFTQYDYTKGQLPELLDVIIDEKAALFVCAVGVPPKSAVEKLHKAGIPIMNVGAFEYSKKDIVDYLSLTDGRSSEGSTIMPRHSTVHDTNG
jgi:hypothetical protein